MAKQGFGEAADDGNGREQSMGDDGQGRAPLWRSELGRIRFQAQSSPAES